MSWKRHGWLLPLLLIVLLGAIDLWHHARIDLTLKPPDGVQSLEPFIAAMPAPEYLRVKKEGKKEFLVWTGPTPGHFLIPRSGPPGYVFDESGHLVDWSRDQGDDSGFQKAWGWLRGDPITLEEARRRFKPQ